VHLLVVDAANVVGSRPDGWWRDRAGAAARLHDQLVGADLPCDEVLLVLEGKARAGVPEGRSGRVRTLHAAGSGDDEIVEVLHQFRADSTDAADSADPPSAADEVTVVTADRPLRGRVEALGAAVVGPSWLLDRLDR
jgi:hypothetical protein